MTKLFFPEGQFNWSILFGADLTEDDLAKGKFVYDSSKIMKIKCLSPVTGKETIQAGWKCQLTADFV